MWFKKKSVLQVEHHYDTEKSADGTTDLRTTWKRYENNSSENNSSINSGLPSAADAGNYFYLPALAGYYYGRLRYVGNVGSYWSSSAYPSASYIAYNLTFNSGLAVVFKDYRTNGYWVGGFE